MTSRRFPLAFCLTTYLIAATGLICAVAWMENLT